MHPSLVSFKALVRRLYSEKGFFERYSELLAECGQGSIAYEQLEREFIEVFGQCKYSDFDSFRVMHSRYLKKRSELAVIEAKLRKK